MTALSRTQLGVLFQRGDRIAVASLLRHATKPDDPRATAYIFLRPYLHADPEGLAVERHGRNLRLHHDEREVFRRTPEASWLFPGDGGPPSYSAQPDFDAVSILRALIEPYQFWAKRYPLAFFHTQQAEGVSVAGRSALRVPIFKHDTEPWPLRSVDVDLEHGVILAADTVRERVEVTEIFFPDSLPDPTWAGPVAERTRAASPLPPRQSGLLRIRVDKWELPQVADIRVGQQVRIPLRFSVDDAVPEQLRATVRGQVTGPHSVTGDRNGPPRWRALLLTDDFHAELVSPIPLHGEVAVAGVLELGDKFGAPVKDVQVSQLFLRHGGAWHGVEHAALRTHPAREMLIDARPARATGPVTPQRFQPIQWAADDEYLWLGDRTLPVARCFSLATGSYAGQVLVPTAPRPEAVSMHLFNDGDRVIASARGARWELCAGQPLALALPAPVEKPQPRIAQAPTLPAGWVFDRWFADNLFSAVAMPPLKEATQLAVGKADPADPAEPVQLRPVDTGEYGLLNGFQLGAECFFTISTGQFRLDSRLQRVEFEPFGPEVHHYVFGDILLSQDAQLLRFLDRTTGNELTNLAQVPRMLSRPLRVARDRIVVLRYPARPNDDGSIAPQSIPTWTPDSGWTEIELQAGPETLY